MKRLKGLPASPREIGILRKQIKRASVSPAGFMAGFTKIELLMVMAIMVILATFSRPGFTKLFPDYQLKAAARDLYSNIQLAKAGAVRERCEWVIRFLPGTNSYEVWSSGSNGVWDGFSEPDDIFIKKVALPTYGGGCSYGPGGATRKVGRNEPIGDSISYPGDRVFFDSRGMTRGTLGGYVYFQNDRKASFAVGTWSSGMAVIRKWNGSSWQ